MISPAAEPRFWAKVDRSHESGCWIWKGAVCGRGYGSFGYDHRRLTASRIAFALAHGPIPQGLFVCHRCDVRTCVNPDHLFLATNAENMRDMREKGRWANQFGRPGALRQFCKRGHRMEGDNVRLYANHSRQCRACALVRSKHYRTQARARLGRANPFHPRAA